LIRFPGIQTSAEIDTYFRAKDETAQGIQSLRSVNFRSSGACYHRLFRSLTVYTAMPCGRSADRRWDPHGSSACSYGRSGRRSGYTSGVRYLLWRTTTPAATS